MPSLMDLPIEIRLRIWGNILPLEVGVCMDEYIARTRVLYAPDGKPIVLHRVAYATTTACHLRCLNRQIYAEILSIPPPILCPRVAKKALHHIIGPCSPLIKQSLRRIKVLGTREPDSGECLLGYFRDVEMTQTSQHDGQYADSINEPWITFAVGRPYPDTQSSTRHWRAAKDRRCCDARDRSFAWIYDDPDYSSGIDSESEDEALSAGVDVHSDSETWEVVDGST